MLRTVQANSIAFQSSTAFYHRRGTESQCSIWNFLVAFDHLSRSGPRCPLTHRLTAAIEDVWLTLT